MGSRSQGLNGAWMVLKSGQGRTSSWDGGAYIKKDCHLKVTSEELVRKAQERGGTMGKEPRRAGVEVQL